MNNNIKVIPTKYKGYLFRSRLEARWAVFFDALDIKWEYEKEGFEFEDGTKYLPDFWLPELNCWIEIKGEEPPLNQQGKYEKLCEATKKNVHVIFGSIDISPFNCNIITHEFDKDCNCATYFMETLVDLLYKKLWINCSIKVKDNILTKLQIAEQHAKGARFEWGEDGTTK